MSYDVTLPKDVLPEYPPECILCEAPNPRSRVRAASHSVHWWTWFSLAPGSKFDAEAPACRHCALAFASRRRRDMIGRLAICAMTAIPAAFVLLSWIRPAGLIAALVALFDPRFWITAIGSLLLIYFPLDVIRRRVFGRVAFDVVAFGKVATYEFTEQRYAERFAQLNGTTVDDPDESFWKWTKERL